MYHLKTSSLAVLIALATMSGAQAATPKGKPTVAEAEKFVQATEAKLKQLGIEGSRN